LSLREGWVPDEEYITVAQASQLSGLSTGHLAHLLREGTIPGIRPGHDWLVKPSAVMAYLKQARKPGPRPGRRKG
jgi:excisionase family DNA binding protein